MFTSIVDCMKEEIPESPALPWQEPRFDCHRQQLMRNLGEFESHLSDSVVGEVPARIYCWDRKRYLYAKRLVLMERWTHQARMIIKQHTCLGSKDVYLFYKHKKDKWIKKYKDWYKEYSQYLALNANYGKMYTKFDADLAALEAKANEQDEEKFPCKAKVSEITGVWTSIKEKDKEVEALREETQAIRFEVETITHRLKHQRTLCATSESRRFKQKVHSFLQTNSALSNTRADSANLAHSHLLSIHKGIHPQMKQEYPLSQHRLKKKDDDTVSDEDAEEEENELKICGAKCRKIPENIKAKFIRKMFDDQVRLQTTVAMTWNVLNKYNKRGFIGKLECIEVEKEISRVESEINEVNGKISTITAEINSCTSMHYEEKIRKEMWLYWIYKIENFVERERVMQFRKKYYSRNHLRAYLMFFGEVASSLPDTGKSECDNWDVTKGLLDSRMAVLAEYIESETNQKTDFQATKDEITPELESAYPCPQNFECTVVGETYTGDKRRSICNMIEDDEEASENEDCRQEKVLDHTAPPAEGDALPKTTNFAIIFSRGDSFQCSINDKLMPPNWKTPDPVVENTNDPNAPNEETPADTPGAVPQFNMLEKRVTYRDELTEAENEIPNFDVTRHERCLSCGTLGIDKFICKSKLKIWTGDITKREKNGMAYIKTLDENGNFVESAQTDCEEANFMQTVQDESKQIVRTKNIAFFLCSTSSSDSTKAKFDFTDPAFCTKCEKFDPENDIMIDGEDGDVDTEESITPSDEEEKGKDKDNKEGGATNAKDTVKKSKSKQKKVVMTHDAKLKVLKNTFKDWLEYCDISDAPSENLQVQTEGSTYTPAYAANPETLTRWEESRCELDYSNVNEMITVADCLYSPSVEDPEKQVLYFKIVKRARDSSGKKSTSNQTEQYTMTVCEKPQGHNELTDEEYQHKKGVTVAKRNHGVIDGKEPDPEAQQVNPLLYFAIGRECMKVCDYATQINLMEMHFTKDELKPQTEGDNEGGRFKNKNVHRFLAKNGIKQKLSLLNNKRHTANNKSNGNVNKVK